MPGVMLGLQQGRICPWKAPGQMRLFPCHNWENEPGSLLEAYSMKPKALFSVLM